MKIKDNAWKFSGASLNTYPIYEILWVDAHGYSGWKDLYVEDDPMYCISVGYLIGEDEYRLFMAASLNNNKEKGDVLYIPKGCILKKRKICPKKRGKPRKSNVIDK